MISFDEFKTYLQLSDDSLEPLFLTYEPIVESDVLEITNKLFDQEYEVSFSKGATVLTGGYFYDQDLFVGAEITGSGIPSNTTLYNWSLESLSIDKYTTSTQDTTITVNPLPEVIKPTVAKMVLYQIRTNTSTEALKQGISAKSMGIVSVTFDKTKTLDNKWDYPRNLVKMCERYKRSSIDIGMSRNPYLATTLPRKYRS